MSCHCRPYISYLENRGQILILQSQIDYNLSIDTVLPLILHVRPAKTIKKHVYIILTLLNPTFI